MSVPSAHPAGMEQVVSMYPDRIVACAPRVMRAGIVPSIRMIVLRSHARMVAPAWTGLGITHACVSMVSMANTVRRISMNA